MKFSSKGKRERERERERERDREREFEVKNPELYKFNLRKELY